MTIKKFLFYIFKPNDPIELIGPERELSEYPTIIHRVKLVLFFLKQRKIKRSLSHFLAFIKQLYSIIFQILLLPVILLLKKKKIYFLYVNFWQIGAYIQQVDSLVKQKYIENSKSKFIILSPNLISENHNINLLFKSKIIVIENFFLYLIFFGFLNTRFFSLTSKEIEINKYGPKFNLIQNKYFLKKKSYQFFNLNKFDIEKEYSKNKKKVVCLHIKNNLFYNYLSQKSRTVNKENYLRSVKFLINKKITVIHFVSNKNELFKLKNKFYVPLFVSNKKNREKQIKYLKMCRFFICTQSGPASFSTIFDTPVLMTNISSYRLFFACKKQDLIIFKKIYNKKFKMFESFKKIFCTKLCNQLSDNVMQELDLVYIENTETEIFNATKDMFFITEKNKLKKNKQNIILKKLITRDTGSYYSSSKISNSFVKKNLDLLV